MYQAAAFFFRRGVGANQRRAPYRVLYAFYI
jgi:hypothetical protein